MSDLANTMPAAASPAPTPLGSTSPGPGRTLARLKADYLNYLDGKRAEIDEQQEARRYYHGAHWTAKQIKTLNQRKQPVVTYNRMARKINAVVGLLERQRQDPKGYARTPRHEDGAEVATAVLRYVLDEQRWQEKSPIAALNGAVDGIGGLELTLEAGDRGDTEIGFEVVDPAGFFYDPTSTRADFSDAGYMGIGKWADAAELLAAFPDKEREIEASVDTGAELTSNPDSDDNWVMGDEHQRRVRVIDHWYRRGNQWSFAIHTGAAILAEGESYLRDEKRRTLCKYVMFSANVDHDGDRYGFFRNMKSAQDEINQRRSKGLHTSQSRRIVIRDGQGLEPEKIRAELARPDASLVVPSGFTQLNTAPGGGSGGRGTVSYRVFEGTESGSTLTGQNGNFINNKLILVFRPNGAINTVTSSTWLGEMTNGDPSSQAISASGQAAPLIRLACLGNSNASQDDFSAGSFDATVVGATPTSGRIRAGYALQNSSPSSNTVDITDLGTLNWLTSGWLSFA